MAETLVIKRDGRVEPFQEDKINNVVKWAVEGIKGVNASDIILSAKVNLTGTVSSSDIHQALIQAAVNCCNVDKSNYQYVAARLLSFEIRKNVWGGMNPPKFLDHLRKMVEDNQYDSIILADYSPEEVNKLDEYIQHERDHSFTYAGMKQMTDKYLVQNRITKQIYETPQFAFMAIAMTVFRNYKKEIRLDYVKKAYDAFSKFKVNLPTPQLAGIRTPLRAYSSCTLIDVGDTLDSIFASNHAIGKAVASRYGIGINLSRMRAIGSSIRSGEVVHTGVVPFLKIFEATVRSCQQNGIRGGNATVNFPFWHYEIEDIIVLKNNGGTDESRVRKMDYVIHLSKLFYERFLKNEDITLFSPNEVPLLTQMFGYHNFDKLYENYENDPSIKLKKKIPARQLMSLIVKERVETGRIYVLNLDHVQSHSAWNIKADMTNLCVEITHPTKPIEDVNDPNGEVGVCVLGAINVVEVSSDKDLENTCDIIVRMLDEIIDHQIYFCPAAENFTKERRSLGIGINGLAGYLAKKGYKYSDPNTPNFVSELQEKNTFYLYKASVELAKEKGACEKFNDTKFYQGILPIDTYKKELDEVVTSKPIMDWESLRVMIKEHGMRHSTLTAQMPCESSSVVSNSTNGIEPIRDPFTFKKSKAGSVPMLAPGYSTYKRYYETAYEIDNKNLLNVVGAITKWLDMAVSTNVYYKYGNYQDGKLPDMEVIKDILYAYKLGIPSLYYCNTDTTVDMDNCAGGACTI